MAAPTPVRDAATVMVVRDQPGGRRGPGFEVLMVRRALRSAFAGGAYVFPGGAIDPADRSPEIAPFCHGRDEAEANDQLGVDAGGLAYYVAAVRECFEEAGLLLAADASGETVAIADHLEEPYASYRRALNDGSGDMVTLCREQSLVLALDRVEYFSHWITPVGAPRRFDTRFFVAEAPPGQSALHDEGETIESVWTTPSDALRRHRDGAFDLLLPTLENLTALARFDRVADLMVAAHRASHVPAMLPRIRVDDHEVRVLLPGDPGYEEVPEDAGLLETMPLPGRAGGPVRGRPS
jgi:8-oxo-dGTP pyrophosphatase MutT (NUDIX family)